MLNDIFLIILSNTFSASIVALAVLLLRVPLKRLPRVFVYLLWSAVIFKMLCPVSVASELSLLNLFMKADSEVAPSVTYVCNSYSRLAGAGAEMLVGETQSSAPGLFAESWLELAARIWLCGAIVVFSNIVTSYFSISRIVSDSIRIMKNRSADIYESESIPNAFVLGFANPKIYLPVGLSEKQILAICEHEQVHVRRCDYLAKHLQYLALSLHWFNPLMWICARLWCDDMECSCDEAVIRRQCRRLPEKDVKLNYSETLFALGGGGRWGLMTPVAFAECSTKERIKNVLGYKSVSTWKYIVSALLTLALAAFLCLNPAVSADAATAGLVYTETNGALTVTGYDGEAADIVIPARYRGRPVTGIEDGAFAGTDITSLTVHAESFDIGQQAFEQCDMLKWVDIKTDKLIIGVLAFGECECLEVVRIESGELTLDSQTFANCRSLKSALFSGNCVNIGDRAFSYCDSLEKAVIDFDNVTITENSFDDCAAGIDYS